MAGGQPLMIHGIPTLFFLISTIDPPSPLRSSWYMLSRKFGRCIPPYCVKLIQCDVLSFSVQALTSLAPSSHFPTLPMHWLLSIIPYSIVFQTYFLIFSHTASVHCPSSNLSVNVWCPVILWNLLISISFSADIASVVSTVLIVTWLNLQSQIEPTVLMWLLFQNCHW